MQDIQDILDMLDMLDILDILYMLYILYITIYAIYYIPPRSQNCAHTPNPNKTLAHVMNDEPSSSFERAMKRQAADRPCLGKPSPDPPTVDSQKWEHGCRSPFKEPFQRLYGAI